GRAHVVPLSPLAMDILGEAKREAKALMANKSKDRTNEPELGPYVFTTTGDRPVSGYSKVKRRLDKAVAETRAQQGNKPLEPWTIHDLRRTVATGLGRLGVSRFIIARVLNHADRSVTGIYDKYEYLAEKRHALEQWGQHVSNLVAPPDAKVVVIRGAA